MARPIKCPEYINIGELRPTLRSGNYKVIEYIRCNKVKIQFENTGYITEVHSSHVKDNTVKDPMAPSAYGVGYLGKVKTSIGNDRAYSIWQAMLQRCYCAKTQVKYPTYLGCTVVTEWHDFSNFLVWYNTNYIEGYELDKDTKILGNKVYGPTTCTFITKGENIAAMSARRFSIEDTSGKPIQGRNLRKHCRDNNLNYKLTHKHQKEIPNG